MKKIKIFIIIIFILLLTSCIHIKNKYYFMGKTWYYNFYNIEYIINYKGKNDEYIKLNFKINILKKIIIIMILMSIIN